MAEDTPTDTPGDDKALAQRIAKLGLTVRPLSNYCLKQTRMRGLIIGYGYSRTVVFKRRQP